MTSANIPDSTDLTPAAPNGPLDPSPVQDTILETPDFPAPSQAPEPAAPRAAGAPMIVFEAVTKIYDPHIVALREVSLTIDKGEFVFLVGPSGSGKSTMMRLLLKELEPTDGRIIVGGRELARLKRSKVPMLRRNMGCVFQDFKLLSDRSAYENVAYALLVQGESRTAIRESRRLIREYDDAKRAGRGTIELDGALVDEPMLRRAQAIVAWAGAAKPSSDAASS